MYKRYIRFFQRITVFSFLVPISVRAQVIPDGSLPDNSIVTPQGDVIQINGGTTRGNNLFHSFTDFSVPANTQASFNNADTIDNILSRVTGGSESIIDGSIGTNGTANLFLINPAGIIFGENAFLDVGGSFISSTADSLIFADGIEYSATNLENPPLLTINISIGLGFGDNPGDIVNTSIVTDDTGEDLIGLRVLEDRTLALIGGNIFIEGGFLSTIGGQIELGSVAEDSTVSITPVTKGFDFEYEQASGFQDIDLSFAAVVNSLGANTGDINLQGNNISLIEGSVIGTETELEGQAGNINITASESLIVDGSRAEVGLGNIESRIFSDLADNATGEGSNININTPALSITDGAFIATTNDDTSSGQGVDINIAASAIDVAGSFMDDEGNSLSSGIFTNVFEEATGNGGDITIVTDNLNLRDGAKIITDTFGVGNGGTLTIDAAELIELTGTISDSNDPSALFANIGTQLPSISSSGNGGNITINTPKLVVQNGAQIATVAQSNGSAGTIAINATESIVLSGFSSTAEFRGLGISGIFVSAEPSLKDPESGDIIPTTGNGGTLNLTTPELTIEKGASISADTFSLGEGGNVNLNAERLIVRDGSEIRAGSLLGVDSPDNQRGAGGTININASDFVKIDGTGNINGTSVRSSILTLAESNGNAGNLFLTTGNLNISNGGEINASAIGTGSAGNIEVNASAIDLTDGSIIASINRGEGGNITLEIADNLTLRDNSSISTQALENANGGNISINSGFVIGVPGSNSDIIANALSGNGGRIEISTQGLFGFESREELTQGNDISASSEFGLDGVVEINTLEIDPTQGIIELPTAFVIPKPLQGCQAGREEDNSSFINTGRGGLPPNPYESLGNINTFVDVQLPSKWIESSVTNQIEPIVEADKWVVNKNGNVELVANNDLDTIVWECGDP